MDGCKPLAVTLSLTHSLYNLHLLTHYFDVKLPDRDSRLTK